MRRLLRKLCKNEQGLALLEFLIVFPFLFLLMFGGLEIARMILIIQKVQNSAYSIGNTVGQLAKPTMPEASGQATVAAVDMIKGQFHTMMWPYGDSTRESIIISSVKREGSGGRFLRWQRSLAGSGEVTSAVTGGGPVNTQRTAAGPCAAAPFIAEYSALVSGMLPNENMIVVEVFYDYQPLWQTMLGEVGAATSSDGSPGFSLAPRTIIRRVFLHPRNGDIATLPNPPAQPLASETANCI